MGEIAGGADETRHRLRTKMITQGSPFHCKGGKVPEREETKTSRNHVWVFDIPHNVGFVVLPHPQHGVDSPRISITENL